MRHTIKYLAAAFMALTALPRAGSAQQTGSTPTARQRAESMMRSPLPVPISGHFTFPLADNCRYEADVSGTARPSRTPVGAESLFTASGNISAGVVCPNRAAISAVEHLSTPRPMTLPEIERAIEARGTLVSNIFGAHCAYVPDFTLTMHRLEGVGAALLCPASNPDATRGGGPPQGGKQ